MTFLVDYLLLFSGSYKNNNNKKTTSSASQPGAVVDQFQSVHRPSSFSSEIVERV